MGNKHVIVLALVATTLAASGCGNSGSGSDSGGGGSSQVLTRAELIETADTICRRVNARTGSTEVSDSRQIAQLLPPLAAYERAAAAELAKLNPPVAMASDWKQILAGARTLAEDTAKYGEYATSKSKTKVRDILAAGEKTLKQAADVAKRNGFNDCARMG